MTKTVEFLLIGFIIGIIGLISGFAVLSARSNTRDVTRLANVREVQMALEMYFQNHSTYPVAVVPIPLGQALTACLSREGFSGPCPSNAPTPYLQNVAVPPTSGLSEKMACGTVNDIYCYSGSADRFRIGFELESGNALLALPKGANCLVESGFKAGICPAL